MTTELNRRAFLGTAAATGLASIVPNSVLGGPRRIAPNDRIAVAHIGMGTQGFNELGGLLEDPGIQIVAVCDPNKFSTDYVEWGKDSIRNTIRGYLGDPKWFEGQRGCPGGRDVGKHVVDTYYARNNRLPAGASGCSVYADFRELLDKEKDLDAVKIMTPDHLHAPIAIACMKQGLHVMMHKPIANRFNEGRRVLEITRSSGVATHLLAHGSGTGNGRIVDRINQGVIGTLREIHNWTNRPVWPQYTEIPTDRPKVPEGFDWSLWLGPEKDRPYHPQYTHTVFRGWYDFGGGSMADMGIYSLWPVFTGLKLGAPRAVEARATHACTISDGVSRTIRNDFSYPAACTFRFQFARPDNQPPLELFWYDGGIRPRLPKEIEAQKPEFGAEGIFYLGDKGAILAGFLGEKPVLYAEGSSKPMELGPEPAGTKDRRTRHQPWTDACRGGEPSPGNFLNAAGITDAVNLGTVALRAGGRIEFDPATARIVSNPDANRYLSRDYRSGWEM